MNCVYLRDTYCTATQRSGGACNPHGDHVDDKSRGIFRTVEDERVCHAQGPFGRRHAQDIYPYLVSALASVSQEVACGERDNIACVFQVPYLDGSPATSVSLFDWNGGLPVSIDLPVQLGIADRRQLVVHDSYRIPTGAGNGDRSCICAFPCVHLTIISAPMQCDHFSMERDGVQ